MNEMEQIECRFCYRDDEQLDNFKREQVSYTNIHTPFPLDLTKTYAKVAVECAPLNISENDGLPEFICDECVSKLEVAYQFVSASTQAQEQLLQRLGPVGVPLKEELLDSDEHVKNYDSDESYATDDSIKRRSDLKPCAFCRKLFRSQKKMLAHVRAAHAAKVINKRPFKCKYCDEVFARHKWLLKHTTKMHHVDTYSFTCKICDRGFKLASKLHQHLRRSHANDSNVHSDLVERLVEELDASKMRIDVANDILQEDKKTTQTVNEKLIMEFAKKVTELSDVDDNNEEDITAKKRPRRNFQCKECGMKCASRFTFSNHIRVHTGDRPHQCKVCHKRFKQRSHIIVHMRIHTGERPYKCETCSCDFVTSSEFRKHLRVTKHTGLKTSPRKTSYVSSINRSKDHRPSPVIDEVLSTNVENAVEFVKTHPIADKREDKTDATIVSPVLTVKVDRSEIDPSEYVIGTPMVEFAKTADVVANHEPFELLCFACSKSFDLMTEYREHIEDVHMTEHEFACRICKFEVTYDTTDLLEKKRVLNPFIEYGMHVFGEHIKLTNLDAHGRFVCFFCFKKNRSAFALANHIRSHTNERPFVCPHCGKNFKQSSHLLIHERGHTNDRRYMCAECGKAFITSSTLKSHILSKHTGEFIKEENADPNADAMRFVDDGGQFKNMKECSFCSKTFVSPSVLYKHIRIHTNERPFHCGQCDKKFKQKSHLLVHERSHNDDKRYKCGDCDTAYVTGSSLKHHQMRVHNKEFPKPEDADGRKMPSRSLNDGPHICEICGRILRSRPMLRMHMRRHTNDKPFGCDHCDKRFFTKAAVRDHQIQHTDEKPVPCMYCDKRLKTPKAMKRHTIIHHTGKPTKKCESCGKCFFESGSLRRHMRVHSGERPQQCDICSKSFKEKTHLKTHMRTHEKTSPQCVFVECVEFGELQ